jgi:hypothetical protein
MSLLRFLRRRKLEAIGRDFIEKSNETALLVLEPSGTITSADIGVDYPYVWPLTPRLRIIRTGIEYDTRADLNAREQAQQRFIAQFPTEHTLSKSVQSKVKELNSTTQSTVSQVLHTHVTESKVHDTIVRSAALSLQAYQRTLIEHLGKSLTKACTSIIQQNCAQLVIEAQKLSGGRDFHSAILPDKVRFMRQEGKKALFILEEKPGLRTAFWGDKVRQIWFPYMVFVIAISGQTYQHMSVFYRYEPLTSLSDQLYVPCFSNSGFALDSQDKAFTMCMKFSCKPGLPHEVCSQAMSAFWNSGFVEDHLSQRQRTYYGSEEKRSRALREQMSAQTSEQVMQADWPLFSSSLEQYMDILLKESHTFNTPEAVQKLTRTASLIAADISAAVQEVAVDMVGSSTTLEKMRTAYRAELSDSVKKLVPHDEIQQIVSQSYEQLYTEKCYTDAFERACTAVKTELVARVEKSLKAEKSITNSLVSMVHASVSLRGGSHV